MIGLIPLLFSVASGPREVTPGLPQRTEEHGLRSQHDRRRGDGSRTGWNRLRLRLLEGSRQMFSVKLYHHCKSIPS